MLIMKKKKKKKKCWLLSKKMLFKQVGLLFILSEESRKVIHHSFASKQPKFTFKLFCNTLTLLKWKVFIY